MNAQSKVEAPTLAKLREPFPANQISKLPKPYKKDSPKGKCNECGGYHGLPAVHLDYVGHAALTDRLLDTDPEWSWEPVAFNEQGLPAFDQSGGLWIRLTVCGVTRLGYGHAASKPNAEIGAREKEVIGDALRNAAMRFGAALDLWHKGDLHADDDADATTHDLATPPVISDADWALIVQLVEKTGTNAQALCEAYKIGSLKEMTATQFADAKGILEKRLAAKVKETVNA